MKLISREIWNTVCSIIGPFQRITDGWYMVTSITVNCGGGDLLCLRGEAALPAETVNNTCKHTTKCLSSSEPTKCNVQKRANWICNCIFKGLEELCSLFIRNVPLYVQPLFLRPSR